MSCNDDTKNITCNVSDYPAMGDYSTWQGIADTALGLAAGFVGQPFDVYRVTDASNGDFIQDANRVLVNYPIWRQKYKEDGSLETLFKSTFFYELTSDFTPILDGDVCVQRDPVYGAGYTSTVFATDQYNAIGIGSIAPLKKRIGGRIDRNVQVFRPKTVPNAPAGNVKIGYFDITINSALCLVCVDGVWELQDQGSSTPSFIPCGLEYDSRRKGPIIPGFPDVPEKYTVNCYIPPLKGFYFREGDIIKAQNGYIYRVSNPYNQDTGFVGNQMTVTEYTSK